MQQVEVEDAAQNRVCAQVPNVIVTVKILPLLRLYKHTIVTNSQRPNTSPMSQP